MLRNAALRWPAVEFEIREVAVQGNTAVAQMIAALRELDAHPDVDVIVIARGGGALEDLLPFSSEELIRAVAAASTPVVSAIGHEADRPILDDVADLRASTPTDAAKRIVPDVVEELVRVRQARDQLRRGVTRLVEREGDRLASLRSRPVLASPDVMISQRHEDVERLKVRSHSAVSTAVVRAADQLVHLKAQVRALSPQKTLDRGYAVVQLAGAGHAPAAHRDVVRHPSPGARRHRPDRSGGRRPVHRPVHRRPGTGRGITRRTVVATRPPVSANTATRQRPEQDHVSTKKHHRGTKREPRAHMAAEPSPNADIEALSYEDAREQLVAVVGKLEAGGASLEESLALWERGEALAKRCEQWLEGARKRLAAARDQAADKN